MLHSDPAQILIVDDNPYNLQVLGTLLREHGYKVTAARNGQEALKFVNTHQPECILMDIVMPELDGIETCRRLKALETCQDVPIIFLTAVNDTWNKVQAFEAGGADYITKPFEAEEVLIRVKTHLTLRNMQKRLHDQNIQLQQEIAERQRAEVELQATQDELRLKNTQLEQANASKDKFFSILSHDLKNAFWGLLEGTNSVLSNFETYPHEKIKATLELLRTNTDRLYALFENLMTWSRLQRGQIEPLLQETSINYFIARSIDLLAHNAAQKQITIINGLENGLEKIAITADLKMIDAVVRNLLSNAIKFTNPGGIVTITAIHGEHAVTVAVSDTGIGIPTNKIATLFQIESTNHRTGTAGELGTGLGLILCKEFVEKHGGAIWVESEVGVGTTFRFTLPIFRDQ